MCGPRLNWLVLKTPDWKKALKIGKTQTQEIFWPTNKSQNNLLDFTTILWPMWV